MEGLLGQCQPQTSSGKPSLAQSESWVLLPVEGLGAGLCLSGPLSGPSVSPCPGLLQALQRGPGARWMPGPLGLASLKSAHSIPPNSLACSCGPIDLCIRHLRLSGGQTLTPSGIGGVISHIPSLSPSLGGRQATYPLA